MNENWLTSTVYALCNSMRQRDDYAQMPLLADALEEAGCTDAEWMNRLRNEADKINAQREVCLILGGELAEAVCNMDEIANGMATDYESEEVIDYRTLLSLGNRFNASAIGSKWGGSEYITQYGSSSWRDYFPTDHFWETWQKIAGVEKVEDISNPFSCSC